MNQEILIKIKNLSVIFNKNFVINNVSIDIFKNQMIAIIGPSGAGKSTLIKSIIGLISLYSGKVMFLKDISIGYMPQKIFIERLMPLKVKRFLELSNNINYDLIDIIINNLSISYLLSYMIHDLSGGELQKVLLARALLNKPDLLILDEPLQGIDLKGQMELYKLINDIRFKFDSTILIVSHDLYLVMNGTDHVVCLNKHVCCSGSPKSISNHPEFISLFGYSCMSKLSFYIHDSHDN